ncbi:hypothetical protein G6011_03991 [Alternaria panax]|uniref:Uncharacterized protein n=1 Tax=Alternaria panax TaxID=48097 RepID=A0AAD4NS04_9PLEO|nr:hypothetical protein G6011_03991 [Alternaria panax]
MVLAPIERLPVELLQPIFIAAGHSIALIQASSYIAARLSSEYVYHSTCDHYLTEVHGKRAELSAVQTYLFASRWMTWNFLKFWIMRRYSSTGCLCGQTPEEGCFDAQWPPNFEDASQMIFSRSHLPQIAVVKGRIPKKLLYGPWNQDKIEFLRFLLWITAMTVDWMNAETAQVAINGRKQAVMEQNLEAVELFNHNRRLGRHADLETVRFAVMHAGCDRSIVYDTLLAANLWYNKKNARYHAELHEWCHSRTAEGDPKGRWLQRKLRESCIMSSQEEAEAMFAPARRDLDPTTEAYDGGAEDMLIEHKLHWNEVCLLPFLWSGTSLVAWGSQLLLSVDI